jgi:dynein assembly factor with WDR repeat domains 1
VWNTDTGVEVQCLDGHEDDIFSCAFNYSGDTIITGSKDNTCRIWRDTNYGKDVKDGTKDD